MKREHLFLLTGMLLAGIIFSFIQLSVAAPAATNPGHPADSIGGTAISDRTFQDATYAFPDALSVGTTTEPTEELNVDGNIQATEFMGIPIIAKRYEYCLTASTYSGNLGGRSGADDKCVSQCGSGYRFARWDDPPVPWNTTDVIGFASTRAFRDDALLVYYGTCPGGTGLNYYWIDGGGIDCSDWTSTSGQGASGQHGYNDRWGCNDQWAISGERRYLDESSGTSAQCQYSTYNRILCVKVTDI